MVGLVKVDVLVSPETAAALVDENRKSALGRLIERIVHPASGDDPLAAVLEATRRAAQEAGLTDAEIDTELEAFRAERRR